MRFNIVKAINQPIIKDYRCISAFALTQLAQDCSKSRYLQNSDEKVTFSDRSLKRRQTVTRRQQQIMFRGSRDFQKAVIKCET